MTNFGRSLQQMGAHSKTILEDLDLTFEYILSKLMKRANLEFSIHSSTSNHDSIKSHIKSLADGMKQKYRSRQ